MTRSQRDDVDLDGGGGDMLVEMILQYYGSRKRQDDEMYVSLFSLPPLYSRLLGRGSWVAHF